MKQEVVAQKILADLEALGLSNEKVEDIIWEFLKLAYAAGYDEGRLQYSKRRPVLQMSLDGKPVKIWESCSIAARHYNRNKTAISKAALGKTKSGISAGFRWKYVDDDGKTNDSGKHDGAGD
jgi:hypothetical protein